MIRRLGSTTFVLMLALFGYGYAVDRLSTKERPRVRDELAIYLPPVAQLLGAGGDRYLAANMDVFRTFMAGTGRLRPEEYEILARLHVDAALFNPGHEDNYYVAAAILPWAGHVSEAQYVLGRAMESRPHDYMPALLYAFDQRHFQKDPVAAAGTLRKAAARSQDERTRISLEVMAANWYEKAEGSGAAAILRLMAAQTRNKDFAAHLNRRAARLDAMAAIEVAVDRWKLERSDLPHSVVDLVHDGFLLAEPVDPFGGSWSITKDGKVTVTEKTN